MCIRDSDQYCYQTSKKIRQVFDYKRRNGQYIGSFAPYGYIKDPKDKHQLIVDPEAAEIVKLFYNMTLQGETRRAIVYHLNDHGIPSPTTYRKNKMCIRDRYQTMACPVLARMLSTFTLWDFGTICPEVPAF